MSVFMLNGMVTDRSADVARADRFSIDYVEITGRGGASTRLCNVCAARELASILEIGARGKFFFRDVGSSNRLVGIERADGMQAFAPLASGSGFLRILLSSNDWLFDTSFVGHR